MDISTSIKIGLTSKLWIHTLSSCLSATLAYDTYSPGSLIKWDAIHYDNIARNGYTFEHEYAFLPVWPLWLHWVGTGWMFAIGQLVLLIVTLYQLGRLTRKVGIVDGRVEMVFVCQGAIFLAAPYAELLFALTQFTAFYFWLENTLVGDACATLLLGVGGLIRSNGIVSAGLFAWRIVENLTEGGLENLTQGQIKRIVWWMLCGIVTLGPFLTWQFHIYARLCPLSASEFSCSTLPYMYIQSKYWNVGLFKYWTASQTGMFLIAAPVYVLTLYALTLSPLPTSARPFLVLLVYLLLHTLVAAHVQIVQRLVTGSPAYYWLCARILEQGSRGWKRALVVYMVIWNLVVNPILFLLFYPPA
jgi:phosphatidylinositol glycan class V